MNQYLIELVIVVFPTIAFSLLLASQSLLFYIAQAGLGNRQIHLLYKQDIEPFFVRRVLICKFGYTYSPHIEKSLLKANITHARRGRIFGLIIASAIPLALFTYVTRSILYAILGASLMGFVLLAWYFGRDLVAKHVLPNHEQN